MNEEIPANSAKKKSNPELYKRNKIKRALLKGEEYINHKGNEVPAKKPKFDCSCKRRCLERMGEDNINEIFSKFHDLNTKDEQDITLQSLIDVKDVERRRPRVGERRMNSAVFKYHVMVGSERCEVCLKAFINVYGTSEKKVRRLKNLKLVGKSPEDGRGKHISFCIAENKKAAMREHITSFPLKESHYSGKTIYYLSAELNLETMHKLYLEKFTELKVSKTTYRNFFLEHYNYRFGRPQVDTCCVCEELKLKIKSPHLNDAAKRCAVAELAVHCRRSKKFYSSLKYEQSEEAKLESHVLSISIDFMQNISLPKVPVQELFYLRQLSLYVFDITNIKTNTSSLYVYNESEAKKGPNEVCSFLFDYFKSVPKNIKEVRLFSDNCYGQNKNQALSRFLLFLTDSGRFDKIQHFFPVRGHSFLPSVRDFGIIKRRLKRHDRIYNTYEIIEHIIQSSKPGKFLVTQVSTSEILNFKDWWQQFYKLRPVSDETKNKTKKEKVYFGISKLYHFVFKGDSKGYITAYSTINGLNKHTFFMSSTNRPVSPPEVCAYPAGRIAMKANKVKDIRAALQYVFEEKKDYFEEVLRAPIEDDVEELFQD